MDFTYSHIIITIEPLRFVQYLWFAPVRTGDNQPVNVQPYSDADGQTPDDEIAAAIMAVQLHLSLEEISGPATPAVESGWHHAAKLSVQSLRPVKLPTVPRWNTIERLRRSSGGFYGITGL
jgi:hypothetical protein